MEYTQDLVVKSNELINGAVDLTLQQQRFVAFIASQLPKRTELPVDRPLKKELSVRKFASMFGVSEKNAYREIEKHTDQLQHKIIQIKRDNTRIKVGIITKALYHDTEGRVEVSLDEEILPHFMELYERFTEYRIRDVYQFKSVNTWRVYELLAQYRKAGTREMTLDDLRWSLGLSGKYTRPTDLKNWIVKPAIKEINSVSDLQVDFDIMKRGRKVVGFRFHIRSKSNEKFKKDIKDNKNTADPPVKIKKINSLLMQYKVAGPQAGSLSKAIYNKGWTIADLENKLLYMKQNYYKIDSPNTSLGGYIYKSLMKELDNQLLLPTDDLTTTGVDLKKIESIKKDIDNNKLSVEGDDLIDKDIKNIIDNVFFSKGLITHKEAIAICKYINRTDYEECFKKREMHIKNSNTPNLQAYKLLLNIIFQKIYDKINN